MITSGATHAGNDPLQQLGVSNNAMNPGSCGYHWGEAQRKCSRETDYNDEDEDKRKDREEDDDDASEDEGETLFQVSEAGNAFLETVFGKQMEATMCRKQVQKQENPDSKWTKCPELDPVVLFQRKLLRLTTRQNDYTPSGWMWQYQLWLLSRTSRMAK